MEKTKEKNKMVMDGLFGALGEACLEKREYKEMAIIALIDLVKCIVDEDEKRKLLGDQCFLSYVCDAADRLKAGTVNWAASGK